MLEIIYSIIRLAPVFLFTSNVARNTPDDFSVYVYTLGIVSFIAPFVSYYTNYKARLFRQYPVILLTQLVCAILAVLLVVTFSPLKVDVLLITIMLLSLAIRVENFLVVLKLKELFNKFTIVFFAGVTIFYLISGSSNWIYYVYNQLLVDILGVVILARLNGPLRFKPSSLRHLARPNWRTLCVNALIGLPSIGLATLCSSSNSLALQYNIIERLRSTLDFGALALANIRHQRISHKPIFIIFCIGYFVCVLLYCHHFKFQISYWLPASAIVMVAFYFKYKLVDKIRFHLLASQHFYLQICMNIWFAFCGYLIYKDLPFDLFLLGTSIFSYVILIGVRRGS